MVKFGLYLPNFGDAISAQAIRNNQARSTDLELRIG
jgi:hypothetical protein